MKGLMDGIHVDFISQANPNDTRGETWQWTQYQGIQLVICARKTGANSCHYHTGEDPSKRPERLFIAHGKVKFTFFNERKGERKELVAEAGTAVSIYPGIIHRTEILEYAIILESRRNMFDTKASDTYSAEIPPEGSVKL